MFPLLRTERVKTDIMKKENRELMEQMLMAIHAKDTLEMLEELIENSDTDIRRQLTGRIYFARKCLYHMSGCKKPSGVIKSDFGTLGEDMVKCLY